MSETTAAPKRRYQRIAPEHLEYAKRRFQEFASTSTVRAELKAQGHEYPYNALFYHWRAVYRARGPVQVGDDL